MHGMGRHRWFRLIGPLLAAGATMAGCGGSDSSSDSTASNNIRIGVLLPLSGNDITHGQDTQATLQVARNDINASLANQGDLHRVQLLIEDTQLDPALTLQKLQTLANQGVRVVMGPHSSVEVAAVKEFADQHGILILSHSSTASSLAIAGDNLFRFIPDDTQVGLAIATRMHQDGIQVVVPVARVDPGNLEGAAAVRQSFTALGGTVTEGVTFAPGTTDVTALEAALRVQVSQALTGNAASAVAVFVAAFEGTALQFEEEPPDPVLDSVRWYGSSGTAQTQAMLANANAAAFAAQVGFTALSFGLDDSLRSRWQPISDRVAALTGRTPWSSALIAYDMLQIAVQSLLQAGLDSSVDTLKNTLVQKADSYSGITGSTALNAAGDRASGSWDFWQVQTLGAGFAWVRVGTFVPPAATGATVRRTSTP